MRTLTKQQQDEWNWKFLFLGANIDAIKVGASMGMTRGSSVTYDSASPVAVAGAYAAAGAQMSNMRSGIKSEFSEEDRLAAMGKKKATSSSGGKKK